MTITCLKLTLVRRAEDDFSASSILLGQTNRSTINDLGRRQSVALAHALPPANSYSLVYSSDLDRALDTAALVVAKSGGLIHRDARLRERHFGARDGELFRAQFKAALFEYSRSAKGIKEGLESFKVPPNGESEVDVRARLADFFSNRLLPDLKAVNSNSSKASVLIVAHDYVIRLLTEYLLEFRGGGAQDDGKKAHPKNFYGAEVPPASITELMVNFGEEFDFEEGGEKLVITDVVVVRIQDTAHLAGII